MERKRKRGRGRERKRDNRYPPSTGLLPKSLQHPGLNQAEANSQDSTLVSHKGDRGPTLEPSAAVAGALAGSWNRNRASTLTAS